MLLRPLGLGLRARVRKRKEKGKQVCGLKETSKMSQESKAEPELEFEPNQMGYKLYNQHTIELYSIWWVHIPGSEWLGLREKG